MRFIRTNIICNNCSLHEEYTVKLTFLAPSPTTPTPYHPHPLPPQPPTTPIPLPSPPLPPPPPTTPTPYHPHPHPFGIQRSSIIEKKFDSNMFAL